MIPPCRAAEETARLARGSWADGYRRAPPGWLMPLAFHDNPRVKGQKRARSLWPACSIRPPTAWRLRLLQILKASKDGTDNEVQNCLNGMAAGIPNSVRRAACTSATAGVPMRLNGLTYKSMHCGPGAKAGLATPMVLIALCALVPRPPLWVNLKLTLGWPPVQGPPGCQETWIQQSGNDGRR